MRSMWHHCEKVMPERMLFRHEKTCLQWNLNGEGVLADRSSKPCIELEDMMALDVGDAPIQRGNQIRTMLKKAADICYA